MTKELVSKISLNSSQIHFKRIIKIKMDGPPYITYVQKSSHKKPILGNKHC